MVVAEDVPKPMEVSDDVTVDNLNELDICSPDNLSSVIGPDHKSIVSSVKTSLVPPDDNDKSVAVSAVAVNDTVEFSTSEPGISTQSELIFTSPSKLVDVLSDAGDDCGVQKALDVKNVDIVDPDTVAVCEMADKTSCDTVVSESLLPSSDMPDTFLSTPTTVGKDIFGDDADPGNIQLDVAEYVEIVNAAD